MLPINGLKKRIPGKIFKERKKHGIPNSIHFRLVYVSVKENSELGGECQDAASSPPETFTSPDQFQVQNINKTFRRKI